jgi:hypothetical protein
MINVISLQDTKAQKKVFGMYNFYHFLLCFYSRLHSKVTEPTNATPLLPLLTIEDKPEAVPSTCFPHNQSLLRCIFLLSSHFLLGR